MEVTINQTKLSLSRGDITRQETDAIVNAANSSLMGGGGVDRAIHHAGGHVITDECKMIIAKIGRLPPGKAVITRGGNLKARYVIHTVGPIWQGGSREETEILSQTYHESLKLAVENQLTSVSFPSISTGAYGYPVAQAAKVALKAVVEFLYYNTSLREVIFVLFDDITYTVYTQALAKITAEARTG